jgi:transposase
MAQRLPHRDTTSVSLRGDYVPERAAQAITMTQGSSKDYRPALPQAVVELLVAQEGGVPLVSQSGDGHASETQLFPERAQALMTAFAKAPTPP